MTAESGSEDLPTDNVVDLFEFRSQAQAADDEMQVLMATPLTLAPEQEATLEAWMEHLTSTDPDIRKQAEKYLRAEMVGDKIPFALGELMLKSATGEDW